MAEQDSIAIIGAGVVGSAIAYALAREGRAVVLIDRAPPGEGGASFGNAGHVATELVCPQQMAGREGRLKSDSDIRDVWIGKP